ncbi:sulfite exporter TauE/SafE family protein [Fodinibius halophilus]|uniref:Probable membrane transporter protein n=1 Tax=Fodinibius halophilus TaxID=1736908 RepID=A0A6M1TBS3_9BACT|nr:sulfite exporter TauE/SafE family protein [Fodinibius halophilus]NGP89431.1 sulfite exporter TauE/SafE family protein [Fodinibius halophilus]
MIEIAVLLVLGIIAGIVAGLFGLGGGVLFTPILFVVFSDAGIQDPVVLTIGSSLFCTFIAAAGSSVRQYQQKNIFWKDGLKVGLMGAAGVYLGKLIITSPYYSKQEFVIFFSLLLFYVAYMFYRRGTKKSDSIETHNNTVTISQSFITGGFGGFVAALAGIGGGGVMVPLLNLLYKKQFVRAVSISSLAIVMISLSGWVQLGFAGNGIDTLTAFHWGYVDFGAALPLAAGGMFGGFAGALFNLKIDRRYLQYAFSALAVGMAIKLIAEVF